MTHTCTLASVFHTLFFRMPGSILDSLLKQDAGQTCATKQAYSRLRNTLWVVWTRIQGDKTGSCHTLWKLPLAANENSVFDMKMELWIINHLWQTHWINLWINLQLRVSGFWSELLFCKRWAYLRVLLPKATSCDVCVRFPCHEFWSLSDDTYISRIWNLSLLAQIAVETMSRTRCLEVLEDS